MKALIIGGGIGGPAAAAALQRAGVRATIYEAHAGPGDSLGLFLGLGVNGMRVLRDLGLLEAVLETDTIDTPWMVFTSATGKRLGRVSNGWLEDGTPSVTLMRGALQRALLEEVRRRGMEVRFGKRFVGYEDLQSRVRVRFEDGSEAEGDLLVGADGIGSAVRGAMDPRAPEPSHTGLLNLGGVVRRSALPATPDAMHMVWGRQAFFGYTVRPCGEAWWFANVGVREEPRAGALASIPARAWKSRLVDLFSGDPRFIAELVERTDRLGAYPIHDMPSLPRWQRGRVALLGDAAHAVSPSAGQGASMALEDAVMLARCLRDLSSPEEALARYEALRRPRAERIVATGRRRGRYKAPRNAATLFLRDLLMPLAFRLFATERSSRWIYDHEIPWDEPVRQEAA